MRNTMKQERKFNINQIESIRITLASSEDIQSWSSGEVTKPETINYRTFKPERDGLFCAKIFGPVTDWECLCGRYKRMKYKGIVCEKCGVEVTQSKVRRERMGHITLAAPVSHIWFFKGLPSRMGSVLDMTIRELERVLYFESYVVVDKGNSGLGDRQVLTEEEFRQAQIDYGRESFTAMMGAEAVKRLLQRVDPEILAEELRASLKGETSTQKRAKLSKRLKIVEAFVKSGNRPEWMVLDILPVIPPELRPLVPLDGGRFATSDLNDLYRRVINRNNRLRKLLDLRAPDVIIRNEKRMLQEAVDALFDNGRRGRVLKGTNNRPLKSLSDTLKGKQGRFRQNLLGKRVDYSGRSVIVVGPELKLHQCGLPKKMALELFKPFIYNKLEERGLATTIKQAREMVERELPEVYDILEEVIQNYPILLNRAPTLHRLGIQAFEPVLVEGKAIQLHPLVCTAFNADFDGDQMAVHVPLSPIAQLEAHILMKSSMNVLLPASGRAIIVPTQDVVLGLYFLTRLRENARGAGKVFGSFEEVMLALEAGVVELHAPIKLRFTGRLIDMDTVEDNQAITETEPQKIDDLLIETTVGRAILNDAIREDIPFVNGLIKKRGLGELVQYAYLNLGREATVRLADRLKELGFTYATRGGISIGIQDMVIPGRKEEVVEKARQEVFGVEKQYMDGAITNRERYNKVIDIWHHCTDAVADAMFQEMKKLEKQEGADLNSVFIMADSGARGSKQQMRQLAGMRGLMAKPSGEIIEQPITNNFREGLNVLQYFISTHGARKGLADTALKTADSGYLTRRLVDVAQDVIIANDDCGTLDGIDMTPLVEAGKEIESLRDRVLGRVTLDDIKDPFTKKAIVKRGTLIDEAIGQKIQDAGVEHVRVRSVLTCENRRGVCAKCYGRNLATGRLVDLGEAVGIIAAQSIGEPGTQLTMRTFHIGGTASKGSDQFTHQAAHDGLVQFHNVRSVTDHAGDLVALNRTGYITVSDEKGREKERHSVVYGAKLKVTDGTQVKKGHVLAEWDPYTNPILSDADGLVHYKDCIDRLTMSEELDPQTGLAQRVILEFKDPSKEPRLVIRAEGAKSGGKNFTLPAGAHIMVEDGEHVYPGTILAKIPRESAKTKDITGGLPRVVELFEARRPKQPAVISEIDGEVHLGEVVRNKRQVIVRSAEGDERTYEIPKGIHLNVHETEVIRAGDQLIDGPIDPHDILRVLGPSELQKYLVNEIQEVYRLQGVNINDKHIEVIVSQMMRWVRIADAGDSGFLNEQQVDKFTFADEVNRVNGEGGTPAQGEPMLLGITKAALSTTSWVSAASFQETTRVLTEAAVNGAEDFLMGLKENVIMGRLIPAGTGFPKYKTTAVAFDPTIKARRPEEVTLAQLTSDLLVGREFVLEEGALSDGTDLVTGAGSISEE